MLHEIRLKVQRLICWLFGHKNHSLVKKDFFSNRSYIECFDCGKTITFAKKDSEEIVRIYANLDEEVKAFNEAIDEQEKSAIKVREQQRRDGVFAKQKRVKKNAKKGNQKTK